MLFRSASFSYALGGNFYGRTGAIINVLSNGIVDILNDTTGTAFYTDVGPIPVINVNNLGLLRKSGGAGLTAIQFSVNNAGTVAANSGTLSLEGGGTSGGSFTAADTASLQFNGGIHTIHAYKHIVNTQVEGEIIL